MAYTPRMFIKIGRDPRVAYSVTDEVQLRYEGYAPEDGGPLYINPAFDPAHMDDITEVLEEHDGDMADIQAQLDAFVGTPGPSGPVSLMFGTPNSTDAAVANWTSDEWVADANYNLIRSNAWLRGVAGSGNTILDIQKDTGSGFATIFTTSPETRLEIDAGDKVSQVQPPAVTSVSAGDRLRAKVISAPVAGGSFIHVGASAIDTVAGTATSLVIPVHASTIAGDFMVGILWGSMSAPVTWPTGWNQLGSPVPVGTATGPQWMFVATKTAVTGEVDLDQSVSWTGAGPAAFSTHTLRNGTFDAVGAGSTNTTANTTANLPADVASTEADAILIRVAGTRFASGITGSAFAFSGGLSVDTATQTSRAAATNFGLHTAHESQAVAGTVAARTLTWTGNARSSATTIIVKPTGGTAATGPIAQVMMQETV